ncbi:HpcH/HpaI aldolase/citrate lyase family protein [Pseudomonas sp. MWU13-2105]|uniref:HpcH/HpaI aldolase/citrate lyase family protein n=1 Tax=Pseudomonas sp. MWU13-2105 TaxID=2935074 RepID=UPI00200F9974|nr:CoA ester lyase [Pseudomonas sp. MWU13-2105]
MIRSFLFAPADNAKIIESALGRPTDVIILDLEDGVHESRKSAARHSINDNLQRIKASKKLAAVRVNGPLNTAVCDLRAVIGENLDIVLLPKVEHYRDVQLISQLVGDLEREKQLAPGRIRFLLQIESAIALPALHQIAAADPRIMGMMLGSEDFSLDCGGKPIPSLLMGPSMMVLFACRAAGIQPIGFIGSIADLGDSTGFKAKLDEAKSLGFRGAVVVHPKYLDAINECYTPNSAALAEATTIVDAFHEADRKGLGAIKVGDLMIDKPVYLRAKRLLDESSNTR